MIARNRIVKVGTDSSGRPIYMTRYMQRWWKRVVKVCGFEPTIVQGAWMKKAGGGAAASAGYHDGGGCLDIRVWNLTDEQVGKLIRTMRRLGGGAWLRDERHGMDPHIHVVLGSDYGLSSGAARQWRNYLLGLDGLATSGPDYHWRPNPIVTRPVFPKKRPLRKALRTAMAEAKRLGYDNIKKRIKNIDKNVKAK